MGDKPIIEVQTIPAKEKVDNFTDGGERSITFPDSFEFVDELIQSMMDTNVRNKKSSMSNRMVCEKCGYKETILGENLVNIDGEDCYQCELCEGWMKR